MSSVTLNLSKEVYGYLLDHSLRESSILHELREETLKSPVGMMQISPEQGQFMALLVKLLNAKKTIDIGTFTGYSALVVALALGPEGKVITCDINNDATTIAKQFWTKAKVNHKIELRLRPALETLQLLQEEQKNTFDFIFIDADKANYLNYYQMSYDLLRQGGIIAIDNVLWDGAVANTSNQENTTQAIRTLNDFVFKDTRMEISMLPIGDGLTLAMKK